MYVDGLLWHYHHMKQYWNRVKKNKRLKQIELKSAKNKGHIDKGKGESKGKGKGKALLIIKDC